MLLLFAANLPQEKSSNEIVRDSSLTFDEAIKGLKFPEQIRKQLKLIDVKYLGFDGKIHIGQLVVNKKVAHDLVTIFDELLKIKFPIHSVIPISQFDWDDEKSMLANNTSCFNYRVIKGTNRLSNHAFGLAIDINPFFNPYVKANSVEPEGAKYIPSRPGTITKDSEVVKIFISKGWKWGGNWGKGKDYQHFEKILK